jgi:hypothetical protein
MIRLANSFALGSLGGGVIISLVSRFVVHDSDGWFALVAAGYAVIGCLWAAIYAPALKVLAIGRREITRDDGRRTSTTAALCVVVQYLIALAARTHEYDRILLFTIPFCAVFIDTVRIRATNRTALSNPPEELADR